MKERPILFSGPMVRAILEGRKTQTRRIVRLPAHPVTWVGWVDGKEDGPGWEAQDVCRPIDDPPEIDHATSLRCPYGVPGDRLWVKETFQSLHHNGVRWVYRADGEDPRTGWDDVPAENRPPMKWRPSIYMPRHVSRLTLKVTGVRVERLHDLTEQDAKAEGVTPVEMETTHRYRRGFALLWDTLNQDRAPWASNPWVWVVSFVPIVKVSPRPNHHVVIADAAGVLDPSAS